MSTYLIEKKFTQQGHSSGPAKQLDAVGLFTL